MSVLLGTMYLVDEPDIDVIYRQCMACPPPHGGIVKGNLIVMDLSEEDDDLELKLPYHAQKATLLLPPPVALYKQIDGDEEGMIQEYLGYLENDSSVQDFVASILTFMHMGGNVILYVPCLIEDGATWLNLLRTYFFTNYGISIGTHTCEYQYDIRYDSSNINLLYTRRLVGPFDYLNIVGYNMGIPANLYMQLRYDLLPLVAQGEDPAIAIEDIRRSVSMGKIITTPLMVFDPYGGEANKC